MAARCRSPPDSSAGRWSSRADRPTRSSSRRASASNPRGRRRCDQRRDQDVLQHAALRQQVVILEHEPDVPVAERGQVRLRQGERVHAVERDRPAGRRVERAEDVEQRALARTRTGP